MTTLFPRWIFAVLIGLSAFVETASAGPVHVATEADRGSGYAFRAGGQCVLLTARHVISSAADAVNVSGDRFRFNVPVSDWTSDPALDVARAIVPPQAAVSCVEPLDNPAWMSARPFTASDVFSVTIRQPDGNERLLRLRYAGGRESRLFFTPDGTRRGAESGYSGSVVMLGNRPVAIITNVSTTSERITATRLDVAYTLWRDLFEARQSRIPAVLKAVTSRGRPSQTLQAPAYEALQKNASFLPTTPTDRMACQLSVDVVSLERRNVPNPEYERWRQPCSGSGFLKQLCEAGKKQQNPPRYIEFYDVAYSLTGERFGQPPRVSFASFSIRMAPGQNDRTLAEIGALRTSLPALLTRGVEQGVCSAP